MSYLTNNLENHKKSVSFCPSPETIMDELFFDGTDSFSSSSSTITRASGDTNALLYDEPQLSSHNSSLHELLSQSLIDVLRNQAGETNDYLSPFEQAILRSKEPIEIDEDQESIICGHRGFWINRMESLNWNGTIPINEYPLNEDPEPKIIRKKSNKKIEYVQEMSVRFLRPPTPPPPGDIIIKHEKNVLVEPAPPIVLRQQPPRPITPEPLIIREAPPKTPKPINRKLITISGKQLPPPPRKVIIEKLPKMPTKPQSILIERWLPYKTLKRRVIFKATEPDPVAIKPKNVIIEWEAPKPIIKSEIKYLNVVRADPVEYVRRYGPTLYSSKNLPNFVHKIKTPEGLILASDFKSNNIHELEGDIEALSLADLDKEGLSDYKEYIKNFGI